MKVFSKNQWIELFREVGLDDKQMKVWHGNFEKRFPEVHQSFLEWLKIPSQEIEAIRSESATAQS